MDENIMNNETAAEAVEINTDVQSEQEAQESASPSQVKKYTDEDVDRIIAKKIAAERKRAAKALELDTQENEFERREKALEKRELMFDVKERLADEGLPYALANLVNYENRETVEASYKDVIEAFNICVEMGIRNRLKGNVPKVGTGDHSDAALRSAFARKL